jgi:acyl-CoA synthetase (AMP-forming)/AMP-acid ligase II
MITPLPIFHMNAMAYSFMAMITVGGCLTILDRFHPSTWWQDVSASNATCLHYLGVMPTMLMGFEPAPQDRAHSIRFGFGAGVDPNLQADFENRFGFPLIEAWAMTETGAGAVIASASKDRLVGKSSIGKPEAAVECKLLDDAGNEATQGELLVRRAGDDPRYGFFSEYYKDPKATQEAWQNGWFHTGDIVRKDLSGNYFFVDRKKNVIRRSGENIAAVEVESVLMRHPEILAAGVAPVPDPVRGDEVFACLKVTDPSVECAHEIIRWCLDQMAYYKAPGYIAFVKELPLTSTQKIQRASLKSRAKELMSDPSTIKTAHLKKRHPS